MYNYVNYCRGLCEKSMMGKLFNAAQEHREFPSREC